MLEQDSSPFFCEKEIKAKSPNEQEEGCRIGLRLKTNSRLVLDHIERTAPTTIYRISKELGISYTTISRIIKDLEFVSLIKTRIVLGDNNLAHREIIVCDPSYMVSPKEREKQTCKCSHAIDDHVPDMECSKCECDYFVEDNSENQDKIEEKI